MILVRPKCDSHGNIGKISKNSHDSQPVDIKWQHLNSYEYLAKNIIM